MCLPTNLNIHYLRFTIIKYYNNLIICSPVCAADSGVDFAMDEDEDYN